MRWIVFAPLTLLLGLASMLLRPLVPAETPWPETLLLVALVTAGRRPPRDRLPAFWWCGFVRDLFLGERLGANALLFSLASLAILGVPRKALAESFLLRAALAFALPLSVLLLRPLLEQATLRPAGYGAVLRLAPSAALFTLVLAPVVALVLSHTPLRTWREEPRPLGSMG